MFKKNFPSLVLLIYGALLFMGGMIGHLKAGSHASLIAGAVSAVLVLLSSLAIYRRNQWGVTMGFLVTSFLAAFFIYRYSLAFKFMPAGFMALISLLVLALLFVWRKSSVHTGKNGGNR